MFFASRPIIKYLLTSLVLITYAMAAVQWSVHFQNHEDGLSEICASHKCMCSKRGYCATSCCCVGEADSEADSLDPGVTQLSSCGSEQQPGLKAHHQLVSHLPMSASNWRPELVKPSPAQWPKLLGERMRGYAPPTPPPRLTT